MLITGELIQKSVIAIPLKKNKNRYISAQLKILLCEVTWQHLDAVACPICHLTPGRLFPDDNAF